MKTIRFDKIDPAIPSILDNPIILHSTETLNMAFGDIRHVSTGVRIYFPRDLHIEVRASFPGMAVLDWYQDQINDIKIILMCCNLSANIGRLQSIAVMRLFEATPVVVRFAEFKENGTRSIVGGIAYIETGNKT